VHNRNTCKFYNRREVELETSFCFSLVGALRIVVSEMMSHVPQGLQGMMIEFSLQTAIALFACMNSLNDPSVKVLIVPVALFHSVASKPHTTERDVLCSSRNMATLN
jgi:hypothetical protein